MRRHRAFAALQLRRDPIRLRELIASESLAAARLEPVLRHGHSELLLDLTFTRPFVNGEESAIAVVPAIVVPTRMVALRECDPLVWPAAVAALLTETIADGVRDRVLPWLVATLAGTGVTSERVTLFDPAFEPRWRRARELRFLGAAPLEAAWSRLAPYLYARRFAAGRRVLAAGGSALLAAPALAGIATEVRLLDADPEAAAFARAWFGVEVSTEDDAAAEVIIADDERANALGSRPATWRLWLGGAGRGERVSLARMVPFEIAFAYSEVRAEAVARWTVETPEVPPPPPPPLAARASSSGRILIAVRPRGERAADSDTDEARALAARLRAEGIEVEVSDAARSAAGFDLLHVIGLHEPVAARDLLATARTSGIPSVVTAQLEDLAQDGYWGAQVSDACFSLRPDEASVEMFLALLAGRRLAGTTAAPGDPLPAEYLDGVRGALELASAVCVAAPGEERLVKERFGYAGPLVQLPPFIPLDAPGPVRWVVGSEPFALLLAPFEPRTNALVALRAAEVARIPLVVAGAVADPAYASLLHEFAGEHGIVIEDPSPELEAGLLAATRLFLDASWISRGLGRIVRAGLGGAEVVASSRGWAPELFAPSLTAVDPGNVAGIAEALRTAWGRAGAGSLGQRLAGWADQQAAFERLLALYGGLAAGAPAVK